jgi:hypothetical protein
VRAALFKGPPLCPAVQPRPSRARARRERAAAGQADPRLPAAGAAVRATHPQGARVQAAHGRPRAHCGPRAARRRRERQGRCRARWASGWGGAHLPRGMAQRPAQLHLVVGNRRRRRGLRLHNPAATCTLQEFRRSQAGTRVCSGSCSPGAARPSAARADAGARRRGRRRRERRRRERAGDDRGAGARGGPRAAAAHLRGPAAHHRRDPGRGVRQQARRRRRVPGAGARGAAARRPSPPRASGRGACCAGSGAPCARARARRARGTGAQGGWLLGAHGARAALSGGAVVQGPNPTLSQVVESTGIVVTPYLEYPQLLGVLLRMLNEGTPPVRHEVLKARAPALRPGGSPACWDAALHRLQAALAMQSFVAAVKTALCGWAAPRGMAARQAGPI